MSPTAGHQDGWGLNNVTWGEAERSEAVLFLEEKQQERCIAVCNKYLT